MPLNENQPRCHALTKSGKPCASPAIKGQKYCRMHIDLAESGVRISGKTGRIKLWREGDLALKLDNKQEHELFEFALDSLSRDFDLNESSDRMQAEMASFYFVKWRGAGCHWQLVCQCLE